MDLPHVGAIFEERYELLNVLGEGGFAIVFRALDRLMAREVALKVLMPQDGAYAPTTSARFMREAQVFAQLQDPHTVTMFDFGRTASGLLYMVFEFVAGRDLKELIRLRAPLEPRVVAPIMEQVLLALREAHEHGVLHRDIKPANILVYELAGDPYRVKLIDFGIAKPTGPEASSITRTGHVVGTLRYMAPEQVLAEAVTFASDIYSLGLVASEMLTGQPAISGSSQRDLLQQQVSEEPLRVDPRLAPAELREIVERMMARDPDARYPSVSAVLNDLVAVRRIVSDWTPGSAVPPPAAPNESSQSQSESSLELPQTRAAWWVPVVAGMAMIVAGAWFMTRRPSPDVVPVARSQAQPTALLVPAATDDAGPSTNGGRDVASGAEGCGSPAPFEGQGVMTSPDTRPWTVHLPAGYDPSRQYPLVLMFHRFMRDGARMVQDSKMGAAADRHGFIVFAFNSSDPTTWPDADVDHVIDAMDEGRKRLCIDPARLYAVGDENGARFAMRLTCLIPVSAYAVGWDSTARTCKPVVPTARMRWYGTADKNQPPQGGWGCNLLAGQFASAKAIEVAWKKTHECAGKARPWGRFTGGSCETWSCEFAPLVSCETNASHQWPGASAPLDIDACTSPAPDNPFPFAEAIWTFFEREGYLLPLTEAP